MLGYGKVDYTCDGTALTVALPADKPNAIAPVLKVTFAD